MGQDTINRHVTMPGESSEKPDDLIAALAQIMQSESSIKPAGGAPASPPPQMIRIPGIEQLVPANGVNPEVAAMSAETLVEPETPAEPAPQPAVVTTPDEVIAAAAAATQPVETAPVTRRGWDAIDKIEEAATQQSGSQELVEDVPSQPNLFQRSTTSVGSWFASQAGRLQRSPAVVGHKVSQLAAGVRHKAEQGAARVGHSARTFGQSMHLVLSPIGAALAIVLLLGGGMLFGDSFLRNNPQPLVDIADAAESFIGPPIRSSLMDDTATMKPLSERLIDTYPTTGVATTDSVPLPVTNDDEDDTPPLPIPDPREPDDAVASVQPDVLPVYITGEQLEELRDNFAAKPAPQAPAPVAAPQAAPKAAAVVVQPQPVVQQPAAPQQVAQAGSVARPLMGGTGGTPPVAAPQAPRPQPVAQPVVQAPVQQQVAVPVQVPQVNAATVGQPPVQVYVPTGIGRPALTCQSNNQNCTIIRMRQF